MIECADSIVPEDLPGTYGTYLVYVDGHWPTAGPVRAMFPKARLITMTVLGGEAVADGCDCEAGDLTPEQAAVWVQRRLTAGEWRPVVYASADAMSGVLWELDDLGIARAKVRLLSAHYGKGNHICGPETCSAMTVDADGTQWTDTAAGVGGTVIDLSTLNDDFFGTVSKVTDIPLNICGVYTDGAGHLYAVGTDKNGVLHESKRTASGVWTTPYAIAGKTGA